MLSSAVLALREGLEAALIAGILISILKKMNLQRLQPVVWAGVASASAVSLVVALILGQLGAEFEGRGEQIFEGLMLLSAAVLLTWMIFWVRRHSSGMRMELEERIRATVENKGRLAVFFAAFTSVLREGVELAIYLLAIRFATSPIQTVLGALLGLVAAVSIGGLLIVSTHKFNLRVFFKLTNIVLLLFAAGMIARGVGELNEAGWIPSIVQQVYNLNAYLPQSSMLGQFFAALLGYSSGPSLTMLAAYLLYLFGLGAALLPKRHLTPVPVEVRRS